MATIFEVLKNVNINIGNKVKEPAIKAQLSNAIAMLEKGYNLDDEVETILELYVDIESVPDKDE